MVLGMEKKILLQYHCVQLGGNCGLSVQETVKEPWIKVKGIRSWWSLEQSKPSAGTAGFGDWIWVCCLGQRVRGSR